MKAEIISTGKEILSGDILDTNTQLITSKLTKKGIDVIFHHSCQDNESDLATLITEASQRAEFVFITGGLGPTSDDKTRFAVSKVLNSPLELNKKALQSMENFFLKRNIKMPEENTVQALIPEKADFIENRFGTAPGIYFKFGKAQFFCFPGVPYELEKMLEIFLEEKIKVYDFYTSEIFTVFGLPESKTGFLLSDFESFFPIDNSSSIVELGIQAVFPHIFVKIYGRGRDLKKLEEKVRRAKDFVAEKVGSKIISSSGKTLYEKTARLLTENKLTLSIAESCTGGLISNNFTDISGSSAFFKMSAVTYSNEAKTDILNVKKETIEKFGAVSKECAMELAYGARLEGKSDFGISTTGIAGPAGGVKDKPVGTVFIGISSEKETKAYRFERDFNDRLLNKKMFAATAVFYLLKELETRY
ncbi:MAG: CinA family nicotinamide mononucleotide deamidase-related protein [Desulfobacteraceae bacterium]|nr:CinA family nicotinamide mononucleotide deamidase-related protein [Desulfobacteraceae bacterium]